MIMYPSPIIIPTSLQNDITTCYGDADRIHLENWMGLLSTKNKDTNDRIS